VTDACPSRRPTPSSATSRRICAFLTRAVCSAPACACSRARGCRGSLLQALVERGLDVAGVEVSADRVAERQIAASGSCRFSRQRRRAPFPRCQLRRGAELSTSSSTFATATPICARCFVCSNRAAGISCRHRTSGRIPCRDDRWRSFTRWRRDHCALHTAGQLERRFGGLGFETDFADVPVVTPFYREEGAAATSAGLGVRLLETLANPDRLPAPALAIRTLYPC
jgi:hypothetical protein